MDVPNVKLNDLYHRTRSDSIDPFTHDLNPGFKNVIQIIFMSLTLAPLRLMCIVFLLFTGKKIWYYLHIVWIMSFGHVVECWKWCVISNDFFCCVFYCSYVIHFGHLEDLEKVALFQQRTCKANLFFFDTLNGWEKKSKQIFKIWWPVKMTWWTQICCGSRRTLRYLSILRPRCSRLLEFEKEITLVFFTRLNL